MRSGCCDDRSIGWIAVERFRQAGELERNCHRDGKDADSRRPGREGEPLIQRPIQGEASEAHQSCDLPETEVRKKWTIVEIKSIQPIQFRAVKPGAITGVPNPYVRIEDGSLHRTSFVGLDIFRSHSRFKRIDVRFDRSTELFPDLSDCAAC